MFDQAEYERGRERLLRLVQEADRASEARRADLEAWDRARNLGEIILRPDPAVAAAVVPPPAVGATLTGIGEMVGTTAIFPANWVGRVNKAVCSLPMEFTSRDVKRWVMEQYGVEDSPGTSATIANTLGRLQRMGGVKLIQRGIGARPSRYRRINGLPSKEATTE